MKQLPTIQELSQSRASTSMKIKERERPFRHDFKVH